MTNRGSEWHQLEPRIHTPGKLPTIRYMSSGLESAEIRKHVRVILEGGDRAFNERTRRFRVGLDR